MISDYGFSRDDVDEDAPQWRKADVNRFLELYNCSSLASFKERFAAEKLPNLTKLSPGGTIWQAPALPQSRDFLSSDTGSF